ncbi:MAG: hypothetical protein DHS20C18_50640 [Saprospiraceae bacterium]|nr:MAG: hypothetical protein DHS20C18_50640 [Saprospiraceae bacterium]
MDRRDSLKSLFVGSLAGTSLLTGCTPEEKALEPAPSPTSTLGPYGRTPEEKERDQKLMQETLFTEDELATLAVLCDIILPTNDEFGGAVDANVPEFVEFMAKDIPAYELPIRGGLMWLNNRAFKDFNQEFKACTPEQQTSIIEEIAYPEVDVPISSQGTGIIFFSLMRDLTMTGYYTSKIGVKALGYQGNMANTWDGVPEEVLQEHGLNYEEEWLAKCINQETRNEVAQWDDEGNLIN